MVNLTSEATWRAPLEELIPVGPFTVKIRFPQQTAAPAARLLVSGAAARVTVESGYAVLGIDTIRDHELIVIG